MEAGGGLVQNINGAAGGLLTELRGQLHPLGLAAGELRGGLAQLHIPKAHVLEGLELVPEPRQGGEELHRLVHRHLQHVGDALAFVADLQGLPVVALALADLAGDEDVRQEVHLDLQHAVAGAGLAPAAPDVEGEPARAVAPALGLRRGGKEVPDVVEKPRIGGGVGAGRAADGALVDVHHLVQVLDAFDAVALAGMDLHAHELRPQALEEYLVDQRRLAGPGDAGDHREGPQGEGNVNVPEVILRRADDFQEFPVACPALRGDGNLLLSGEVLAREAIGVGHDLLRRAGSHHLPAVDAGAGADVDEVVGGAHGVLVMLHHQEGIAQVPEVFQRGQELVVIPLVQSDGGLVQDIEDPHQGRADLGGQADALALAAGEGSGGAAEGQVPQAHRLQKAQAGLDLL